MLHCFSVDVEGFCEGMAESISVPAGMLGGVAERREIATNMAELLEWLAEQRVLGTFFILGRIAEQQPSLIRDIVAGGHEIASHSHQHLRLYNLSLPDARRQIERSKKTLEDVSGQPVLGFRAPDFSITRRNMELLDALCECGYAYDSSIVPAACHDVYGVPGANRRIHRLVSGLLEFPPSTARVASQVFPALGGGYLRMTPTWMACILTEYLQSTGRPVMSYIHPYEIGSVCPEIDGLTWQRRFRHYGNRRRARSRYTSMFRRFRFGRALDVLQQQGFPLATTDQSRLA